MKIAITSWGWHTPLGNKVDSVVQRLLLGESAVGTNPRFDASTYQVGLSTSLGDAPRPTTKAQRHLRRMGLFGLSAAQQAVEGLTLCEPERLGLFAGVGGLRAYWNDFMPALENQRSDGADSWRRGFRSLHPFWMLQHLSNNTQAILAVELQARGEGINFGGANGGTQALCSAIESLQSQVIDQAIVVAYDTLLEPETLVEMAARKAATNTTLAKLAPPYDENASGFVPGEAAACLILERATDATTRTKAWLHAAESADRGEGACGHAAIETVMAAVKRIANQDALVDGCAQGHPGADRAERAALASCVSSNMRLTAIQGALGNMGAATSLVQAIAFTSCLHRGLLPPIAGLKFPSRGALDLAMLDQPASLETKGTSYLALQTGAPGLAGAIRVELP